MNTQKMSFSENSPKTEPWVRVGSGFTTKNGNGFNLVIGNAVPSKDDPKVMVETVSNIVLVPGSELYLGIATNKKGEIIKTKNGATVYRLQLKPMREPEATLPVHPEGDEISGEGEQA